jgi:hypothetical protein
MALYAVTRGRRVEIDVEYMRDDFAALEVAERFFSKAVPQKSIAMIKQGLCESETRNPSDACCFKTSIETVTWFMATVSSSAPRRKSC